MYRGKREGSKLIDFGMSSDNARMIELSDALIIELKVEQKHIDKRRRILISILENLYSNNICGFKTAIPLGENFYSGIPQRYKLDNISKDLTKDLIDKLKPRYVIEHLKGHKNETEATHYSPTKELLTLIELTDSRENVIFRTKEVILLRGKVNEVVKEKKKIKLKGAIVKTKGVKIPKEEKLTVENEIEAGIEAESKVVRTKKKCLIEYDDTPETNSMRQDLNKYNEVRKSSNISLKNLPEILFKKYQKKIQEYALENLNLVRPDSNGLYNVNLRKTFLVRIFNVDYEHGGRFYWGVESEISKVLRPYLAINGNETVELDYKALHPRMLYHMSGKYAPEDPYMVRVGLEDKWRNLLKIVSLICINIDSEKKALHAIRKHIKKNDLEDDFVDMTNESLKPLIKAFENHNKHISHLFYKRKGMELQNLDSKIANDVLKYFATKKTPVLALCIHDSFIVEKVHKDELFKVMRKFYRLRLRKQPIIT
ncbi:MAG: hypothetical protein NTY74_13880 [Ignavibacteriae bacterium]|nr:hypothetical protein [Ignavibacteriota bacterium]